MFASKETGVSSIPSELASVDEDKIINVSNYILYVPLISICQTWSGSNLVDTPMVFLKEFFENVDFEKNQQMTKNMNDFPGAKVGYSDRSIRKLLF